MLSNLQLTIVETGNITRYCHDFRPGVGALNNVVDASLDGVWIGQFVDSVTISNANVRAKRRTNQFGICVNDTMGSIVYHQNIKCRGW